MRLSASISAIALAALPSVALKQAPSRKPALPSRKANEVTLAGLRPGIDTAALAHRLYKNLSPDADEKNELSGVAFCPPQKLTIETDANHKIQTVRTDIVFFDGDCLKTEQMPWRTGLGLRVGDAAARVTQLYGTPDSRSPSTKGGQRLELLYYAFDWAGPNVPQVMEVLCTVAKNGVPGRVVEITLAASSL